MGAGRGLGEGESPRSERSVEDGRSRGEGIAISRRAGPRDRSSKLYVYGLRISSREAMLVYSRTGGLSSASVQAALTGLHAGVSVGRDKRSPDGPARAPAPPRLSVLQYNPAPRRWQRVSARSFHNIARASRRSRPCRMNALRSSAATRSSHCRRSSTRADRDRRPAPIEAAAPRRGSEPAGPGDAADDAD